MLRIVSRFQNFAHRAMQRFALSVVAVLSFGISSNYAFGQSAEQSRKLARLEATYISHLTKYVQWNRGTASNELKVIVHGDDHFKFQETLEYVMKITGGDKRARILDFADNQAEEALLEAKKGFNFLILLKGSSIKPQQLGGMEKLGVIVVNGQDFQKFSAAQIGFEHSQNRVRLLIDRNAIGENNNQISSRLADLKSAVKVVNKKSN